MSAYFDTSALLPILLEEPASNAVHVCLLALEEELLVSDFAAAEVASALSRLVRMALLDPADASARMADFEIWRAATAVPADLHGADARLAYSIVRRFEPMLRAPDALQLAIARRLDATLVTLDRRMALAAATLGITVRIPAADDAG